MFEQQLNIKDIEPIKRVLACRWLLPIELSIYFINII